MNNGDTIPVSLDMHLVNGMWKIYNGSVGNLSFIINYRGQFNSMISAGGLSAVLNRMQKRYGHPSTQSQESGNTSKAS